MTINGSCIRDITRVLKISTNTVIIHLKKSKETKNFQYKIVEQYNKDKKLSVNVVKIKEAELDEMWSFVKNKDKQRWLWYDIEHKTGKILAYTFEKCKDAVLAEFRKILEPFGITKFYADNWRSYSKHLNLEVHEVGKKNTQIIERKNLTLRTRIKILSYETIVFQSPQLCMILSLV